MCEVSFPFFNLNFNINNIAFKIGNIDIYWYAIFITLAIFTCLLLCNKDDGKYGINCEDVLTLAIWVIPISIISARIYFVIFNLQYYTNHLNELFNIRNGGIAIYGGIIGGVITVITYCKIKKINFLDMLDYIAPFLPLGQAIGRLGNFTNVEAHGTTTDSIFRMGIVENGTYIEVHPTFLYELVLDLFIFVFLYCLRNKRKFKGEITYLYFIFYGLARFFIEGLRTDSLMLGNFRVSQVLSLVLFVTFGSIFLYKKKRIVKQDI